MAGNFCWKVHLNITEVPEAKRALDLTKEYSDAQVMILTLADGEQYEIFRPFGSQDAFFMQNAAGFYAPAGNVVFLRRLKKALPKAFLFISAETRVRAEHYPELKLGSKRLQNVKGCVVKGHYDLFDESGRSLIMSYDYFVISVQGGDPSAVSRLLAQIMEGK